jgi:anti-sigma B factor antagonist
VNSARFELTVLEPAPGAAMDIAVARIRGDIDVTNARELQQGLDNLAARPVIVDLSEVGYFDSAGFAVLDRLLSQRSMAVVIAPASVVRTAMTLMGLPFHDTLDAARAELSLS